MSNNILISIIGPTAVGKTALSLELAKKYDTEIISADSKQFYREMNIGTAKPNADELKSIKHHFINSLSIEQDYNAGQFEKDAIAKIESLFKTKSVLITVGGSGLYTKALWDGLDDFPEIPEKIRSELIEKYNREGLEPLLKILEQADPEFYSTGEIQNPQRVIRALEIYEYSGKPMSDFKLKKQKSRSFKIIKIGLNTERKKLYARINQRVDEMLKNGLEEEARTLHSKKELNALLTIGYQEFFDFFDKKTSREEAIRLIKRNSRRYAKRQLTWFRKQENIQWFEPGDTEQILTFVAEKVQLEKLS